MLIEQNTDQGATRSGRQALSLLPLILALCLSGCSRVTPPEQGKDGPAPTLTDAAIASRHVEFIVFSRNVPPVLEKLRARFPTVSVRELDVDDEDNQKRWVEYGSDAVPYYYVLADGKVVARFRGFLPYDNAVAFLRDALKN